MRTLPFGSLARRASSSAIFWIAGAALLGAVFMSPFSAHAAVTVAAPAIDGLFIDATTGGGSYIPLMQFKLQQNSGSDTLTNVKVGILATSTINSLTTGEINRLLLYRESGGHFGFQPTEDVLLNTGANTVTDPATNTQITITVDTGQGSVGASPVDYFIVARATTSAALVNGHKFYATTSADWITTSAGALTLNPFNGIRTITFRQSAGIKISEVRASATGNAGDEFIELYNTDETPVDLSLLPLSLFIYNSSGGAGLKTLTYYNKVIPSRGYFLITSETNYSGSVPPDAVYTTLSGNPLAANTGFSIATSSTVANATSSALDRVGWGSQPAANTEGGTAPADLGADKSYERKASTSATATTMAPGGVDATKGNAHDLNDNRLDNDGNSTDAGDFVEQSGAGVNPQNALSPAEFPFTGGFVDMQNLQVQGSFPGPNQMNTPLDISFVGFGFNKVVATGTIISATATGTLTLTTGGSSNLCTSVSYNPFPNNFEPSVKCSLSAALSPNTTYTFVASTSIRDLSGNALDQDPFQAGNQPYSITFTTGGAGQTQTNTTPPRVIGTTPFSSSANIPKNLAAIFVKFSQSTIDTSTLTSSNISLSSSGGAISLSSFSFNASTSILSFVPGTLAADTMYTLTVGTGVRSLNGISLPSQYFTTFTTGSSDDTSAPGVVGIVPAPSTSLALNAVDFTIITDDYLDPSTATSGAVTLSFSGSNLPGTVSYDPIAKELHFTATNPLPAGASNNLTLTLVANALKNISGTQIGAKTYTWSTESSNSDSVGPMMLFANADGFGFAVTFNEAVKVTDAENLSNYQLNVGGSTTTLSSLAGHKASYDSTRRTTQLSGLFLQPGSSFRIITSTIKDISGNLMSGLNSFVGTVLSPQMSGGVLGPGQSTGDFGPKMTDFSNAGIGFIPGLRVMPLNAFINASTTYGFEVPISQQIPSGGTIVITFPSSSDFGLCCAVTTSVTNPFLNEQNKDINGPGSGTIGFQSITADATSKTVTLTLNAATRSENSDTHDFLRFSIIDLKNPSIPKGTDSSGYTFDIKTKNSSGTLLESFTSNSVFISGGSIGGSATTTIRGTVSGAGANLAGVTIRLSSPQIGLLETTTNGSGLYTFQDVPVNNQIASFGSVGTEYFLSTDSVVRPTGTSSAFFGEPVPTQMRATSTSIITRNFPLTATSSAINFTVKLTADNSGGAVFKANEQLDIFAGGPGQFSVQTITTTATNYSAATLTVLPIPQVNGSWGIGIGPALPKGMGNVQFGPPPAPTWVVPKPINLVVSGCPSSCVATINGSTATTYTFTVSSANRTIEGVLRDGSGNAISSAMVFAFSPAAGIGNQGQTSPSGAFTIRVTDGSFNVGAFIPGVGSSREVPVVVNSSGTFVDGATSASTGSTGGNPFILTLKKPSYTITGRVTDGSSAVANAPVFAYRTNNPGHVDSVSDSSGTYTLYVDNGTWKINAFIPGFGPMAEQTVTISGASKSDINFSPSTATTFRTIAGTVFESADATIDSGEGVSGVIVRVSGASGLNETTTGSDGTYSLRVPNGNSYAFADIFKPGYGRIAAIDANLAAIGSFNVTATTTKNIRMGVRRTITVSVKDSGDSALTVPRASIDLFDVSKNFGNHAEIVNGTTTTLLIPNGASSTIRVFVEGVPPSNVSVASDNGSTLVLNGVLEVNGNEAIKITVNTTAAALYTVSGRAYAGSIASGNEIPDTWVQFVDPTNNIRFGTQATSSGWFSIKVAAGTYQIQALKPGYVGNATTATISADTTALNLVTAQAGQTITGSVTAGGSAAAGAYVWAEKLSGGFTSTKTNTAGAYSLTVDSGEWRVFAAAEGYAKTPYGSNPVTVGATGVNIALTTAASINSKLATSNSFSDTATGSLSDTTIGVKINLDSGTLGSSGTSAYLSAKETSNFPETLDTSIIGSTAYDIDAVNGSSAITNLQTGKTAEITLTYTKAELTAASITSTSSVGTLTVVSWSDDKKSWESLSTVATYRDSDSNATTSTVNLSNVASVDFTTAVASHFSEYALSAPSDASAPATPTGFSASQQTGNTATLMTWTANSESDLSGYFIYRSTSSSGSFPLRATLGAVTTYTDTADAGVTYYYKISAYDTASNESAATAAQTVTINNVAGGSSGGGSGGGGSPSIGQTFPSPAPTPAPVAKTTTVAQTQITTTASPAQSVGVLGSASVFTRDLVRGNANDDVRRLQELLKSDPTLYPEAVVNGIFGPATFRAVVRFQTKYKLPAIGRVGPATRAKFKDVFTLKTVAQEPTPQTPATPVQPPSLSGTLTFSGDLERGQTGASVSRLQEILKQDPAIYPEGIINGTFGPATFRAVRRFQIKYGLPSVGRVGPATRAKLELLVKITAAPAPAPVPAPAPQLAATTSLPLPSASSTVATSSSPVVLTATSTAATSTTVTAAATSSTTTTAATSTAATTTTAR